LLGALDFLYAEWNDKAVAFVSYGIDGGIRAVEHLRQIAGELQLADIRAAVSLSFAADFEGYTQFKPAEGRDSAVAGMLDDLLRWGRALKSIRTAAVPAALQRRREMPTVVIRYQLHPEQVEENLRLLDEVYREMHTVRPAGLSYTTIQLDDDVTFLAIVSGDAGPGVLSGLPVFQHYRTTLDQRCIHPPVMTAGRTIHAYDALPT